MRSTPSQAQPHLSTNQASHPTTGQKAALIHEGSESPQPMAFDKGDHVVAQAVEIFCHRRITPHSIRCALCYLRLSAGRLATTIKNPFTKEGVTDGWFPAGRLNGSHHVPCLEAL